MLRSVTLGIALAALGSARLAAADFTLIEALPTRLAAERDKADKVSEPGGVSQLRHASNQYGAALQAVISDLITTYYKNDAVTKAKMEEFIKELYAVHRFKKELTYPSGGAVDRMVGLEIQDDICEELEAMIPEMVEVITIHEGKFDFKGWQKKWNAALKGN